MTYYGLILLTPEIIFEKMPFWTVKIFEKFSETITAKGNNNKIAGFVHRLINNIHAM